MAEGLMSVEADAICGAEYGQRSGERVNRRNGYRERDWDIRAGTVDRRRNAGREPHHPSDHRLTCRNRITQRLSYTTPRT
jgi:transposase-like protein